MPMDKLNWIFSSVRLSFLMILGWAKLTNKTNQETDELKKIKTLTPDSLEPFRKYNFWWSFEMLKDLNKAWGFCCWWSLSRERNWLPGSWDNDRDTLESQRASIFAGSMRTIHLHTLESCMWHWERLKAITIPTHSLQHQLICLSITHWWPVFS